MIKQGIYKIVFMAGLVAIAALIVAGAATASTIPVFSNFSGTPSL